MPICRGYVFVISNGASYVTGGKEVAIGGRTGLQPLYLQGLVAVIDNCGAVGNKDYGAVV